MKMMKYFADFNFFTEKINSAEPFVFSRYGDGEVSLMLGREVGINTQAFQVDNWKSPNRMTKVGRDLLETMSHTEENYWYGIPTETDLISPHNYKFLKDFIKTDKITFANLWINANYVRMKEFYQNFNKPAYVICNHIANPPNFPFKVAEFFPFPDDCVGFWETYGDDYLSQLLDYTSQINGQTIFVSAGPVSEILLHKMYMSNPNNQYIDVGSSLDEFVHGRKTRPYMDMNSIYAKQVSYFENKND